MSRLLKVFRRFVSCIGPGYIVAVGYMDPGNWVAGLAAGSGFGYTLLSVIGISNLIALCVQYHALKVGLVTGRDLATWCRTAFCPPVAYSLWILAELAIIATDLAEVIGSALGLQLLFGIPLLAGVVLTGADVLLLLAVTSGYSGRLQAMVMGLIAVIIACFGVIVYIVQPDWAAVCAGLVPTPAILTNPDMLYIAIGILGATVMPHNLYLHSGIMARQSACAMGCSLRERIRYASGDMIIALTIAGAINAALVIIAAAVFYHQGFTQVVDIQQAYQLFEPLMNSKWASICFAIALLAAGQNSTITGTLAGQMVMEGFVQVRWAPWKRRLVGRVLAIAPALLLLAWWGSAGISRLLLLSQVILSFQLPFAMVPLIWISGNTTYMGQLVSHKALMLLSWLCAAVIIGLNLWLVLILVF